MIGRHIIDLNKDDVVVTITLLFLMLTWHFADLEIETVAPGSSPGMALFRGKMSIPFCVAITDIPIID